MRLLRHSRGQYPLHLVITVYCVDYQGIYPVCSPRLRASASVLVQEVAFATDVPPDIYAFTATPGIPLPSPILKSNSFKCTSGVKPRAFTPDLKDRLRALYAQ